MKRFQQRFEGRTKRATGRYFRDATFLIGEGLPLFNRDLDGHTFGASGRRWHRSRGISERSSAGRIRL